MGAKTWLSQTYNRLPPLFAPNYAWLWAESLSPTCYAPDPPICQIPEAWYNPAQQIERQKALTGTSTDREWSQREEVIG
jgi:hypothetical protein